MRVGLIALLHESNTFIRRPTALADFEQGTLLEGSAIRDQLAETHHEIGGFFAGLAAHEAEVVPIFVARALPSGVIEAATWEELMRRMLRGLERAGRLDGVLVAPHGATVCESCLDADGDWLRRVRDCVGPSVPIVGTLDLHANLSAQMVASCEALIAYRSNPHLDQRQRGMEAASLLLRTLSGEVLPTMAAAFPAMAINIERQATAEPHLRSVYQLAEAQRQRPGVLSTSLLLGFPYADVPEMGAATVAITDNDPALARALAQELSAELLARRKDLVGKLWNVDAAMHRVRAVEDRICLLDMGDNVGGGSAADGTVLVHALHEQRIPRAFVCLYDPAAVAEAEAAGIGSRVLLAMGGKVDDQHGPPFVAEVSVASLHDGHFQEQQPRHGGISTFDQGRTAIVETSKGLTVMLTSRRMVPFSLEQLRSCGLDPRQFRVLVAKGVHAPVAAYREVCRRFLRVNTPGSTCADLSKLEFRHRRRPMFPFEAVPED